ncbi:MAG: MATE family efflux transporter [Cephaloticoccus sp.]|nr:MATE family efflux transporter [Cephaloticoccus sp.]
MQSTLTEVRRTLTLAFPIIVGHLSQMLMGITDSVMIGRIGAVELAASAFANVLFTVSFITGIGILMSVSVLVARAHGAKQSRDCAEYLRHGIWLGVGLALAGMAMMFGAALRLDHFGQPAEVVAAVEPYLQLIAFSLVPTLLFQVFRQFSEAVGHPWGPMAILLGGVALNVVLNWVLIYGNLGAPALGLAGAGWATLIARITAATVLWLWLRQRSEVRAEWPARNANPRWFAPISRSHLRAMFGIGIPAAGQLLFEAGAFAAAALMMGWIGTIALAAHQIALNCAACVFMVPLGLSIATSVRIGRAVGENNAAALRPIGFGSLATGVCFAAVFTVIFALAGKFIVAGFTHDTAVVALAARLLIVAAIFQVFDGGQAIAAGALRGMADVKIPTVITFTAYWIIALPTGYFLGVRGIGPLGVWYGLAAGLAFAAVLLARRFYVKTAPAGL